MTFQEFRIYKEHTFDAFCRTVIRNTGMDIRRVLVRKSSREVHVSDLSYNVYPTLYTTDSYRTDVTNFDVFGNRIQITNWALGEALYALPPKFRNVVLLTYFLDQTAPQIGKLLHTSARAFRYRKTTALNRLRRIMQELEDEANKTDLIRDDHSSRSWRFRCHE